MLLKNVGLQMWSVRDEMKADFAGTFKAVAEMGYKGVELCGYGGKTPAEMAAILKDNGLEAWGTHIGLPTRDKAFWEKEIEMNLAVGNKYIVHPGAHMNCRDDVLRNAEIMNETALELAKVGIKLGYHNHSFEFAKDGGEYLLDILMNNLEKNVFLEADVFWVLNGGEDIIKYISKFPERLCLVHLKEMAKDSNKNVEIGTGRIDFASVIRTAQEMGTQHFIVEQEEYTMPVLESCKASLDALLKL